MLAAAARRRANTALVASASDVVERAWDVSDKFRVSLGEARRVLSISAHVNSSEPLTPPPCASTFPPYEPCDFFRFELVHQSSRSSARVGRIHTPHGTINTPAFVPVGTNGALKAVSHRILPQAGLDLMFANTYHLMVQPGEQHIENAGGLHEFINRRTAPLITDSGGFQIFSLGAATDKRESSDSDSREMKTRLSSKHKSPQSLIKSVTENGVVFKSYRDGKIMELTPESSVAAQKRLGADIIIPLDELPPYAIDADALKESLFRSHRWEARSLRAHLNDKRKQAMYAVIHGGVDDALRKTSCEYLTSLPFDGFAIGGSLGKNTEELVKMLTNMMPLLPKDRPNHLLGIGDEVSIRKSVGLGVDAFDSTFPTRSARHGSLLTRTRGRVNIRNAKNKSLHEPPCFECACPLCTNHTMAYLHHLDRAREPMAWTLATEHNLWYMGYMMREIRGKIARDEL